MPIALGHAAILAKAGVTMDGLVDPKLEHGLVVAQIRRRVIESAEGEDGNQSLAIDVVLRSRNAGLSD